ncbi:UDP-2,4-diacetamido-2,4,6-trideoxy-beta-L-altropyranose hydrolase [Haliovirga abyssi]|uniref:N-acetyltransferase domain-containing protein n=1 Tax=Haliovirga abyssi TaxID=2996794 RepID=A0AAU9D959_9FUSO|nr:UDP-2,4-diacetamido-2,4,6-trideoxy-beta-L-altropyranose hydrolase [Haliovirga abyssi]BDU51153.1 hypothetical protein HLVA_17220 [Haliovirga abyssi]
MDNKFYIFTEGGTEIGYGHITRCSALYEEIEKRGYEVEFIINGDEEVLDIIKNKKIRLIDWRDENYLSNLLHKNDYVIIDSYLADKEIYKFISNKVGKILYIDDNQRIEYPKGIVVNPSIYGKELNYPEKERIRYLLGANYVILRKEFLNIPIMKNHKDNKDNKDNKEKIEDILITFGGSDIKNITPKILKLLAKNDLKLKKHIVIGKGYKNIAQIKKEADNNTNFYYNLNAEEMKNLMLKCDFAISAAGQTIYELLRIGIPFVAIKVADNQENNIKGLSKLGINCFDEFTIEKLKLYYFKIPKIIDGKGVNRIINNFFIDYKIRKLEEKDKKNIYDLSNKDYVRRYSLNKNKILWSEHLIWFDKQLNDKNTIFFVIESGKNDFLGQVRLNKIIDKEEAVISASFSEKIKGKGMGKYILGDVIKKVKKERDDIKNIIAVINKNNISSVKLFKRLGFNLFKEGEEFSKYIKKI